MNDRFKFRVWSKNYNEYLTGSQVSTLLYFGYRDDFYIEFNSFSTFADDLIIEQCTGLKDKNGNLIYEGDIVKAVTDTYKVIWDRHRWAIKSSQGYIFSEYINDLLYDCEIIGNIHETKGE